MTAYTSQKKLRCAWTCFLTMRSYAKKVYTVTTAIADRSEELFNFSFFYFFFFFFIFSFFHFFIFSFFHFFHFFIFSFFPFFHVFSFIHFFHFFMFFHFPGLPGPFLKHCFFLTFSCENLDFKARFWVKERRQERKKARKKERRKEGKKERRTRRQKLVHFQTSRTGRLIACVETPHSDSFAWNQTGSS